MRMLYEPSTLYVSRLQNILQFSGMIRMVRILVYLFKINDKISKILNNTVTSNYFN